MWYKQSQFVADWLEAVRVVRVVMLLPRGTNVRNEANFRRCPVAQGYRGIGHGAIVQNEPNLPGTAGRYGAWRRGTREIVRNEANSLQLSAVKNPVTMPAARIL